MTDDKDSNHDAGSKPSYQPARWKPLHVGCITTCLLLFLIVKCAEDHAPSLGTAPEQATTAGVADMSRDQVIAEVKRRIDQRRTEDDPSGLDLLLEKFGAQINDDRELTALRDKAWAADAKFTGSGKLERGWATMSAARQQIAEDAKHDPDTVAEINEQLGHFEEAARNIAETAPAATAKADLAKLKAFQAFVASEQVARFPILRQAYAKGLGKAVWESNVAVRASGKGAKDLWLTGAVFVDNGNIASNQRGAEDVYKRLRFGRIFYEWYHASNGYHYTLRTPVDRAIGLWANGVFTAIR